MELLKMKFHFFLVFVCESKFRSPTVTLRRAKMCELRHKFSTQKLEMNSFFHNSTRNARWRISRNFPFSSEREIVVIFLPKQLKIL